MRISMDMHRPAEAVIGFLLIAVPFVAAVGAAALVIAVLLGAILIAVAYGGFREGDPIAPATHVALDRLVAAGIGIAALVALVAAHVLGAVILALLGLAMTGLVLTTRYVAQPPDRATAATWDSRRQGSARG
jgi:hypothetical protein